jgi:hypothetical protein
LDPDQDFVYQAVGIVDDVYFGGTQLNLSSVEQTEI